MEGFNQYLWGWESKERWIKHYASTHNILLVGEGDFSFSLCLAIHFASATNIVATSLDSYDELIKKYRNARENLAMLQALGASLFHGVDATKMSMLHQLQWKKFHRIVYNFPHAGFLGKEDSPQLIKKHKDLVRGFLSNAMRMLRSDGEIHISHKVTPPFTDWKLEDLAVECSLRVIGLEKFRIKDYPGYENKRGSGLRPDQPFPLGECKTYKFELSPSAKLYAMQTIYQTFQASVNLQQPPVPFPLQPSSSSFTVDSNISDECRIIFRSYLNHVERTFGSANYDEYQIVCEALRNGLETYMSLPPGRSLNGYIDILEELHRWSTSRSQRLQQMLLLC